MSKDLSASEARHVEGTRMNAREIAEAFCGHRFGEAAPHLAPTVRWLLPG